MHARERGKGGWRMQAVDQSIPQIANARAHARPKGLLHRRSTSRSTMSAEAPPLIKVPLPFVIGIPIDRRLAHDDNVSMASHEAITFYPPNSPRQWPRTMGDITQAVMDSYLALGGPGTMGSTPPLFKPLHTNKPFDQSLSMASYTPTTASFGCRK
jgi:hypothetical protein